MKKSILFLIVLIATLPGKTQDFAPIGSIWHYTQSTINPNLTSYKTIESLSDTMINGIQCKKLIEVERYIDTSNIVYHYMYSNNDSVFFYKQNNFHLIYDFGANAGDTIVLDYFLTSNNTPLKMIIDSTDIITVGNTTRKIQYITCGDGIFVELGNHVIEGIGNTSFMFPTNDGSINGPLRCYQDSSTGLYLSPYHPNYNWNHLVCNEIITGIEEKNPDNEIILFPNPTNGAISISNVNTCTTYRILNVNGEESIKGHFSDSKMININELTKGIYFIELQNKDSITIKKIIKI